MLFKLSLKARSTLLTFSKLHRTISVIGLCFSLCLSTSICICAISLACARAIRASVCSLACRAKKSASSTGGVEFMPESSLRDGRLNICGLAGVCCFPSCFEPSDIGVDPGDTSFSEPGDSVSDDVSFMKQIWRFIPAQSECLIARIATLRVNYLHMQLHTRCIRLIIRYHIIRGTKFLFLYEPL